jgi:arylsulfatase A-like enzyme
MLNMKTFSFSIAILFSHLPSALAFKGALIVPHAWGYNDLTDVKNSEILKYLPNSINDFTAAAADTNPSQLGFLTGNMQLTSPETWSVPSNNLHSMFNSANIDTGHFGLWNFSNSPVAGTDFVSSNPGMTINNALQFIHTHNNYFVTVFMPLVDVAFFQQDTDLRPYGGVSVKSKICKDEVTRDSNPSIYKNCPREIYIASRNFEDKLLGKLLAELARQNAFTIWAGDHGAINQHLHSNSAPRTSLRGAQFSLYDGGIRTQFRYNHGAYKMFAQTAANAIDILPSLGSLVNTAVPATDGINLFDAKAQRTQALQWATNRAAEGHCSNISPARAIKIQSNGKDYMLLYDLLRTEVYAWHSRYQMAMETIPLPTLNRPKISFTACSLPKALGISRNIAAKSKPPRVIINFLTDDEGFGDLSLTSARPQTNNYPRTKNIDAAAKTGLFFSNFYTSAAVCSPTRASIMSARYPFNSDVRMHAAVPYPGSYNPADGVTRYLGYQRNNTYISTFFAAKGWKTGHFGKWHLCYSDSGINPGNSIYAVDSFKCYLCPVANPALYYNNQALMFPAYSSQDITNKTISFISSTIANGDRAFVQTWIHSAHAPTNMYQQQPAQLGFPDSSNPYVIPGNPTLTVNVKPLQIHNAAIKDQDDQVGRIFDYLQAAKLYDDTIFVYSSDNGPEYESMYLMASGSPGPHRGQKRSLYEGGIHVPFFIKWGNKITGSTDMLASSVDIYPTLAGLAGYNYHDAFDAARFDGLDLSGCILRNDCSAVNNRAIIWEQRIQVLGGSCLDISPRYAIRQGDYKLLLHSGNKVAPAHDSFSRTELYNVVQDPFESQNLATLEPAIVDKLTLILRSYPHYDASLWPAKMGNNVQTYKSKDMYVGMRCV